MIIVEARWRRKWFIWFLLTQYEFRQNTVPILFLIIYRIILLILFTARFVLKRDLSLIILRYINRIYLNIIFGICLRRYWPRLFLPTILEYILPLLCLSTIFHALLQLYYQIISIEYLLPWSPIPSIHLFLLLFLDFLFIFVI